jgi:hypothetical protein
MSKSGIVTIVVVGTFVYWVARHTIEDALWRRDERRAGEFLAAQVPPPPPVAPPPAFVRSTERLPGVPVEDPSAFSRAMEGWGEDLFPTFNALLELDCYWAEDWEMSA